MDTNTTDFKLRKARAQLLSRAPFYGGMACKLKLRELTDDSFPFNKSTVPTMGTDGVHLWYNPDFVNSKSNEELMALWAHEVSHPILRHQMRCGTRDQKLFNIAGDMAINSHLKDGGFNLPSDAVYPEQKHWNEAAEMHYERLFKNAKKINVCLGGGSPDEKGRSGGCSGILPLLDKDGSPVSAQELRDLEDEWNIAVHKAAALARSVGKLPAHIQLLVDSMTKPKVSWTEVLRRFMTSTLKDDYRMMPPNRRYIHQGLYLPSLRSDAVPAIALFLDGSGSTYEDFPQFITEFKSILGDVRPEVLYVVVWDTEAHYFRKFSRYDDIPTAAELAKEMQAGGGTVFTGAFEWLDEQIEEPPVAAIWLTDMAVFGWPDEPAYPVMWIATADGDAPYGEVLKLY